MSAKGISFFDITNSAYNLKPAKSKLKESTGKLVCLIDEIECKSRSKSFRMQFDDDASTEITDNYDDCSIYKKLTRICQCLDQGQFADIIMEFNSETQYHTSQFGEILKNMRILKKFLYIGNYYTSNAFDFLIEGFETSNPIQKREIVEACAYADLCNIFDELSLVKKCIVLEYRNKQNTSIPMLATKLLSHLTETKEGRKYLTLTSKLTHEMIDFMKFEGTRLVPEFRDAICDVLDVLKPGPQLKNFYFKPLDKGHCKETVNFLLQFHDEMSLEEVTCNLETLKSIVCDTPRMKSELLKHLPLLLSIFKSVIVKHNSSQINIIVTHILNNLVTRNIVDDESSDQELTKQKDHKSTGVKTYYLDQTTSPIFPHKKKKTKVDFQIPTSYSPMSKNCNGIHLNMKSTSNKKIIYVPRAKNTQL